MSKDCITCQVYLTNAAELVLGTWPNPSYSVSMGGVSEYLIREGYIHLKEVTIEMEELPSRETLVVKTVQALRDKIAKTRADAEVEARQYTQQINDLLMIGHDTVEGE